MARRAIFTLALAILAVSCGVSGEYGAVQKFQDGIYYKGFDKDMQVAEPLSEEDFQRLQQIGTLLQFNPDVSAYLMAEFRFQRMLSDIFKILADVAGIDLDMLSQG